MTPAKGRKKEARGPLISALKQAREHFDGSVWLYADPLTATNSSTGELSRFARRHRNWLMWNTHNSLVPLGEDGMRPLFSWVNLDFRRMLGDCLVSMAQQHPIGGIVLDLRHVPIATDDPQSWFCCAFSSQRRVEETLGYNLERLLAVGSREEIAEWQDWVWNELRCFIESLKARVEAVRSDLCWLMLVPSPADRPIEHSPWMEWFAEGLVAELAVASDDWGAGFLSAFDRIDRTAGSRLPIMPVLANEGAAVSYADRLRMLPATGYWVWEPDLDGTTDLPKVPVEWDGTGALEDDPEEAALALTEYIAKELGDESRVGKFYRRIHHYLGEFDPDPVSLSRLIASVNRTEERMALGEVDVPVDKKHLQREIALVSRMLHLIHPAVAVT
ncbi:hypothetical protein KQI84_06440 [bacterium]|nr:hypothetical protein [bacterium]